MFHHTIDLGSLIDKTAQQLKENPNLTNEDFQNVNDFIDSMVKELSDSFSNYLFQNLENEFKK